MFSLAGKINKNYSFDQLKNLPEPVQNYFQYSLSEGQPYISYVRLKHEGKFRQKPNQKWVPIKGEEYFTLQNPGFIWKGQVPMISAIDKYIDGKGSLIVKLFSLFKLVDYSGKEADQGELFRWLSEAVWYPTALLPSENLKWAPLDALSAKVTYSDPGISIEGIYYFNEFGQIIGFNGCRYFEEARLESWTVKCGDYRVVNNIKIPFYAEVTWNLDNGDFTYAKFKLLEIEYDVPAMF